MDMVERIVTRTPLAELWNSDGLLDARRTGDLGEADIKRPLQGGSNFVVAEVGQPLRWISESDCFAFWKAEVKCRLVAPDKDGFHVEDYPGSYCYVAAMWECASRTPVIVLEKHH